VHWEALVGPINYRDVWAGALFVVVGVTFVVYALLTLNLGRAMNMGPGYFPVLLGILLTGFGAIIAVKALKATPELMGSVSWRAVALITFGVGFFAATVRGLGMAAALFVAIFCATMSTGQTRPLDAALISAIMAAFCIGLFVYALELPYAVIGPWLGGY
jgi:hypothetical protein